VRGRLQGRDIRGRIYISHQGINAQVPSLHFPCQLFCL
jgi:predicted sulfurtransferase